MADDIRLVIGVEQSGLLKAITNTESLEKKVKKLSDAYARDAVSYGRYNKAIGDLATATKKSKKELLDYGKALRAEEQATKQAALATKQFAQARRDATAEDQRRTAESKKGTLELDRMRKSVDKAYAADQKFTKYKRLLRAEVDKGNLSIKEAARLQLQYRESIQQQGKVLGATKNRMNGTNMAIQQLGYQFGDFAVQVQGGTSAFVAFSQQGSQLAGILPMIAAPLGISMGLAVGLSSAFGILIPIGSALARTFFDVGKAADKSASDFKDALSEFESVSEDLSEVMKVALTSPFTEAKGELRSLFEAYKQIKAEVAKDALATSLMPIVESVGDVLSSATRKKETTERLNIGTGEQAVAARVKRLSGLVDIQLEAADILNLINDAMQGPTEDLASNMLKVSKALRDSEVITHGIKDDFLRIIAESGILAKIQKGYSEEQRTAMAARRAAGMAYGKQEDAINADIHQALVDRIFEEYETRVKADEDAVELRRAAGEAFFKQEQELEADIHKMRVDNILKEVALRAATISAARAKFNAGAGQYGEASQDVAAQRLAELRKAWADFLRPNKSSVTKESDLEKLERQIDLERALVYETEARQRVIQALGVEFSKKNPQIVADLEKKIQLTKELIQEEQQRKDLIDFVANRMGDSFMSMVDGTKSVKDAFRDMAADIVRHLYKVLVVQQMINSFGGMLSGSSNASIAKIGGALESYDNGGYTGNGPRSGGLDGKGGFMAIMHPRETVVDHTKGQQANTNGPTIVQNFNFSANGDDSVKKIIAQAAPQIAQMTKNSMLNDRRRGGTTKAVFG